MASTSLVVCEPALEARAKLRSVLNRKAAKRGIKRDAYLLFLERGSEREDDTYY